MTEYTPTFTSSARSCCVCGLELPFGSNGHICGSCVQTSVDVTSDIPRTIHIVACKACGRYSAPPSAWIAAARESKELLAYLLKRVKGLSKVSLVDASFIWTEPHSKRLAVKITVQADLASVIAGGSVAGGGTGGAVLQQDAIIEFVVGTLMCPQCHQVEAATAGGRSGASGFPWSALAQVRQRVPHKRTFYWLEQQILSSKLHLEALGIRERGDGLDFYYTALNKCKKMVDYLASLVPLRYSISKKLVSYIEHTNEYSFKHTIMVELAPVCRDDVVILPKETARKMGGVAPIMLCHKVTSSLHLIDPFTLSTLDVNAAAYFRAPFEAIASRTSLIKYAVQDVSPRAVDPSVLTSSAHSPSASKFSLADVTVVRLDQLGLEDAEELHTITHLGHLLRPGDLALGVDLRHVNMIQVHAERVQAYTERVPEVLLVRKTFERKSKGRRKVKPWTLKRMTVQAAGASDDEADAPVEGADSAAAAAKDNRKRRQARRKREKGAKNAPGALTEAARKADFETFLDDLEEDPDLREGVQIYKGPSLAAAAAAGLAGTDVGVRTEEEEDDEDVPQIPIEEMLDNMTLND